METPLLKTKLYIPPPRPDRVPRPRLIERLNASIRSGCKLTLISAPTGFGKTTLLSEWVHTIDKTTSPINIAWISLDEGDNDFTYFMTHFIAALQKVKPGLGQTILAVFQSPQLPPVEVVLANLINEIATAGSDRLVVVLDDYHVIRSSTNQAVTFLLERLPTQLHLIIMTRRDPSLPLARLRAQGYMTEIRVSDLQFTTKEVTLFLNQFMDLTLTPEEIILLESRTEGWIAGLQLAALALQRRSARQHRTEFIRTFSGDDRYVIDYLVSEVLSGQPQEVQHFLQQTAVLDHLYGPLCDTVLFGNAETPNDSPVPAIHAVPHGESQRLLERLDRANLFLVPLDNRREWYRYHHLFRDVLLRRLRQAEPDQIPELHRRASAWYEGEGYIDEAIHHALTAQDWERAAQLVESNALQLLIHSELTTLIRWLDALPDDLIHSRPWLCVYSAWAQFIISKVQVVQLHLRDAEQLSHLAEPELLGHIAVIRARLALSDQDFISAAQLTRQAMTYVPEHHPIRGHIAVIQGQMAFMQGDLVEANRALRKAVSIAQACGHLFMVVDATTRLGYLQTLQGHLHEALKTCLRALKLASVGRRTLPVAGNSHVLMALVLRQQNELNAAAQHMMQGVELCRLLGNPRSAYLAQSHLYQAQGDWDGALRAVQDAERLGKDSTPVWDFLELEHSWLWLALVRANLSPDSTTPSHNITEQKEQARLTVSQWVQESALSADDELVFSRETEYISLARALITLNKPVEASRLLERLFLAAKVGGRIGRVIEILVLRALALQSQKKSVQAVSCLEDALVLAEPEGYVRLFVDEGQVMMELLGQALSRGIVPEFTRKLLAAFHATANKISTQSLIDPLSERELEVLRLLATSLSSTDIARELTVAISTVRSHTKSIYSKLNVHRRLDAVERAKELRLI